MTITLREANKILQAAEASASAAGIKVSMSVVDPRGDLVALARMDGSRYFSADVASGKARVSAIFGQPSGVFEDRASSAPGLQALMQMHQGHLLFVQGAVPIIRGNEIIGAMGVSGGTAQEDEDAAKAGLAAL